MKKFIFITLFSIGALLNTFAQDASSTNIINKGDKMPSFSIKTSKANISSESLKGKVVLITLFTTWCGPCQKELAEIEKTLWPKFKNNSQFELLVIGREHDENEINKYIETKNFTFPIYPDKDKSIYNLFAKSYIPRTYLVDKNGTVIYQSVGF